MYNLPNIIFRRVSHLVEHHCLDMTAVLFKISCLHFDSMYKFNNHELNKEFKKVDSLEFKKTFSLLVNSLSSIL